MTKKRKVVKQLIGIEVFKGSCGGIQLSYLIDGAQKIIYVGGTHYTDVSLVQGDESIDLDDRELADSAIGLIRSIADKWEEFKEDAIREYQYEADRRLRLKLEQKAASAAA